MPFELTIIGTMLLGLDEVQDMYFLLKRRLRNPTAWRKHQPSDSERQSWERTEAQDYQALSCVVV